MARKEQQMAFFVESPSSFVLQMLLIEDGQNEDHLFEAESFLTRRGYDDVVIERNHSNICGYPVCRNALPSQMRDTLCYSKMSMDDRQKNVLLYCSSSCKFNSIIFALRLEYNYPRYSVLSPDKKLDDFSLLDEEDAKQAQFLKSKNKKLKQFLKSEDENLPQFLESFLEYEHLSDLEVKYVEGLEAKRKRKRKRTEKEAEKGKMGRERRLINYGFVKRRNNGFNNGTAPRRIETGFFSKLPPELIHHILKFMSFEDLMSCSLVCSFLNYAASDESLWHRLYHMRWGSSARAHKTVCPWKVLYIQHDAVDLATAIKGRHDEYGKYCIEMLINIRREAPHLSLVNDDRILLDKSLADEVTSWKSSRGLRDTVAKDHACSAKTCSYYRIGDTFICEKTGHVHVCDDTCKQEVLLDATNEDLCCTISLINHGLTDR